MPCNDMDGMRRLNIFVLCKIDRWSENRRFEMDRLYEGQRVEVKNRKA